MTSKSQRSSSSDKEETKTLGKQHHEDLLVVHTVLTQSLSEQRAFDKSNTIRQESSMTSQPIFNITVEAMEINTPYLPQNSVPNCLISHKSLEKGPSSSSSSPKFQTNPMNTSTMTFGQPNILETKDSGNFKWNELLQSHSLPGWPAKD